MLKSIIVSEIRELCVEQYTETGSLNIADVTYEYIENNRELLEENADFPLEDDDIFAEEIALCIDEDSVIADAKEIIKTKQLR